MRGITVAATALAVAACAGTGVATAGGASGATDRGTGGAASAASTTPGGTTPGGATPASTAPTASWPAFDQNAARTGVAPGLAAAGKLSTAWTAHLDGAVYGQPLVVGGEVIAATENDSLYALSRTTGKLIWRKHVGTPVAQSQLNGCGDIFPLGITGTPVYDQADGLVYAVAEISGYHHMLVGLSATTGAVKLHRYLDEPTATNQPAYNQQRPALTISQGRVYAAFGGLAGDCGAYQGSVVGAPLTGNGALVRWQVPTSREGAIWGTGGPVVGPQGDLWVSVGNGAAGAGKSYDGSDSVTMLSPALQRVSYFAPSSWAADNDSDLDLGSTQPALAAGDAVFIMGKRGVGYLLNHDRLGGIGGQLAEQNICAAFGAAAVSGTTVYEPCSVGGPGRRLGQRGQARRSRCCGAARPTATARRSSAAARSG